MLWTRRAAVGLVRQLVEHGDVRQRLHPRQPDDGTGGRQPHALPRRRRPLRRPRPHRSRQGILGVSPPPPPPPPPSSCWDCGTDTELWPAPARWHCESFAEVFVGGGGVATPVPGPIDRRRRQRRGARWWTALSFFWGGFGLARLFYLFSNVVVLGFYRVSLGFWGGGRWLDCAGIYWVFTGLYRLALGLAGNDWILLVFTGFYWVLLRFTRFYMVTFSWFLPCFSWFRWQWLDFTGLFCVLIGFTWFHLIALSFIKFYWVLTGFVGFSLGFIGFHWVLIGFIGSSFGFDWFYWVKFGFYWVLLGFT